MADRKERRRRRQAAELRTALTGQEAENQRLRAALAAEQAETQRLRAAVSAGQAEADGLRAQLRAAQAGLRLVTQRCVRLEAQLERVSHEAAAEREAWCQELLRQRRRHPDHAAPLTGRTVAVIGQPGHQDLCRRVVADLGGRLLFAGGWEKTDRVRRVVQRADLVVVSIPHCSHTTTGLVAQEAARRGTPVRSLYSFGVGRFEAVLLAGPGGGTGGAAVG